MHEVHRHRRRGIGDEEDDARSLGAIDAAAAGARHGRARLGGGSVCGACADGGREARAEPGRDQQAAHQSGEQPLVDHLPAEQLRARPGERSSRSAGARTCCSSPCCRSGSARTGTSITRPVVPLFVSQPHPDPEPGDPTHIGRSTAFGDITLLQLISPSPELAGELAARARAELDLPHGRLPISRAAASTRSGPRLSSAISRTSGSWAPWSRTGGRSRAPTRGRARPR